MRAANSNRTFALAASVLLLTGCSTAPPSSQAAAVVIGVDVSRDTADQGAADTIASAVRFVVETQYHGRVDGVPISVLVLDDSTQGRPDPAKAAANLRSLVQDRRVIGVVGPIQSSLAVTEIPIAAAAHLSLVSPANTNPCLTRTGGDCGDLAAQLHGTAPLSYFRVLATDDGIGPAAAAFSVGVLKAGPFAIGSDGLTYGRSLADAFAAEVKRRGGAVALRRDFDPHSKAALDSFFMDSAGSGARAAFYGGRQAGGACLVRKAMAGLLGPESPFFGGDGILLPACLQEAGGGPGGIYAVSSGPDLEHPAAAAGAPSGPYSAAALDAAGVIVAALSRAIKGNGGNLPTRDDVRAQLAMTHDFHGALGSFGFDANGDTTLRIYSIWTAAGSAPAWARLATVGV